MGEIFIVPLFMGAFGAFFGAALSIASFVLKVEKDPRIEAVEEILPGLDCGSCGFPSCSAAAEAIVSGKAPPNICLPGGEKVAKQLAVLMGAGEVKYERKVAVVKCSGGSSKKYEYKGPHSCAADNALNGGHLDCQWGCLGWGDCIKACPEDAIKINENSVAQINWSKCTGCGLCVAACPRNLIEIVPFNAGYYIACNSHDGLLTKKICPNGCYGCGICALPKFNPAGIVEMKEKHPEISWDKVSSPEELALAGSKCPVKVWRKIS